MNAGWMNRLRYFALASDPETGARGGLLTRSRADNVVPKILYTHSSWEYWGSAASLVQTAVDGSADFAPADSSRAYLLASTQHVPAAWPPRAQEASRGQRLPNPLDYRPVLRALYVALDQWVRGGDAPPPSQYPRLANRELVARSQLNEKGFTPRGAPAHEQFAMRLDHGEKVAGVATQIPPATGKPYATLVPQVDDDGNDAGGVRVPELSVPLATYTGWNLRHPATGAPGDLVQLVGGYQPFARTRAEREQAGDTRASVAERYASREDFLVRVETAARALVAQRLLLPADRVICFEDLATRAYPAHKRVCKHCRELAPMAAVWHGSGAAKPIARAQQSLADTRVEVPGIGRANVTAVCRGIDRMVGPRPVITG